MITIIHGEDSLKARNRFISIISEARRKGFEIIRGETSSSLFSDKVLIVLENIKTFPKLEAGVDVLILYDGDAPASLTKSLPKGFKSEKFDLPKKLFKFLDSLYPKNSRNSLALLHELTQAEPIELVFTMIGRLFRDLYWVTVDPKSLNYPEWRAAKLKNQAQKFSSQKLKKIIYSLSEIDRKAKSGEVGLGASLDLFMASELE